MLNIFSCAYLYIFFGEMSVQNFGPFTNILFSYYCVWRLLCIFLIQVLYQIYDLKIFSPVCGLSFYSSKLCFSRSRNSFLCSHFTSCFKQPFFFLLLLSWYIEGNGMSHRGRTEQAGHTQGSLSAHHFPRAQSLKVKGHPGRRVDLAT